MLVFIPAVPGSITGGCAAFCASPRESFWPLAAPTFGQIGRATARRIVLMTLCLLIFLVMLEDLFPSFGNPSFGVGLLVFYVSSFAYMLFQSAREDLKDKARRREWEEANQREQMLTSRNTTSPRTGTI